MRRLLFALFWAASTLASEPWPGVKYQEVRAYYYNEDGLDDAALVENGRLHPTVVNKGGTPMQPAQIKALLDLLNRDKRESLLPGCYSPRHGVVFYDHNKKVVAFYEVCFSCFLQRAEPEGLAPLTNLPAVAKIFEQLKLPLGSRGKTAEDVRKEWEQIVGPEPAKAKGK